MIRGSRIIGLFTAVLIAVMCTAYVYAEEYEPSDFEYVGVENTEYLLTDINGDTVSTLADGKPKILFFFNTSCPRCKAVENDIKEYGFNTDKVDFVMAEASNGGVSRETAEAFYKELGLNPTAKCYGAVDVCWEYLRECGYTAETTKKPIIIYISKDNTILGYSWNYTNIHKNAETLGMSIETSKHQWEPLYKVDKDTGKVTCCDACRVCGITRTRTIKIPEPSETEFTYDGKAKTVLEGIQGYTVADGKATAAGEYEAVVSLEDTEGCEWSDGTTEDKVIEWSIARAEQKPVITTSSKTYKRSYVKKHTRSFSLKTSGVQGKATYAKISGSSRLKVSSTTGKISVKKGTRKGTYRIKVQLSCEATDNYEAGISPVKTITVKVK